VISEVPTPAPRLGFTVTETVLPPEPVEPDPFLGQPAPAGGNGAVRRDAPERDQ
jgi:hypothetical protein